MAAKKGGSGGRKSGGKGGKKETSDKMSSLASKAMRNPGGLSKKDIRSLGGSVLGQDETKGKRGKR